MTERRALCTITATDEAHRALDRLMGENGPLVLRITSGGSDAGAPMCALPSGFSLTPDEGLRFVIRDSRAAGVDQK